MSKRRLMAVVSPPSAALDVVSRTFQVLPPFPLSPHADLILLGYWLVLS